MHDLVVKNGQVFDGTGRPGFTADIFVDGGRITEVGQANSGADAREVIDAAGRIVTPGFIDPHTHMDAQLFWDPSGSPSVLHGVTSVVLGSCGIGIAPMSKDLSEYVLRSLESVEEIPYRSTAAALPFSWSSWSEYMATVDALPLGINVGAFVPHCSLRTGVLGERGLASDLDAGEIDRLVAAASEALEDGAVGISSTRGPNHTDALGQPVPSRLAGDPELAALVALCTGRIWQINIAAKGAASEAGCAAAVAELNRYADWSSEHDTLATWSPLVVAPGDDLAWRRLLALSTERSDTLLAQVCPQSFCSTISFDGPSYASMVDGWAAPFAGYTDLDDAGRQARLASEQFRAALRAVEVDETRITSPNFRRWTILTSPSTSEVVGMSLTELGEHTGRHPIDALLDLAARDDLGTVVRAPLSNLDEDEAAMRALISEPTTLFGIGDAGAHVRSITNYTYPTHVLATLTRDRAWLSLPQAVSRLTSQPAGALGLRGRGVLEAGAAADLCVIDLDGLAIEPASIVHDLPEGSGRLHSAASGYDAVLVNGEVVVRHDRVTGRSPGRLIGPGL